MLIINRKARQNINKNTIDFLEKGQYKVGLEDGTNNLLLNFVDFTFLLIYCVLSGYNVYKTFDLNTSPSYLLFILNIMELLRYYIANKVKIRDVKKAYLKEHGGCLGNLNIEATKFRTIIECVSLSVSTVFIVVGRVWGNDILGIKSVSVVALISVVIVIFTGIENVIGIAVNMFKAEPKIFIELKEEGEG